MKKILLLIVLSLVLGGSAYAAKIIHLDATRPASVIGDSAPDPADPNIIVDFVSKWLDQSGAGNDAIASGGDVITYPSGYVGSGGLPGLSFTGGSYQMELLTVAESQALLDLTGATTGGFSMFIAVMDDPEGGTPSISDVLGVNSSKSSGVCMRYKSGGDLTVFMNGLQLTDNNALDNGDTYVQAVNYDAATGAMTVLHNARGPITTLTGTVSPGNFSANKALYIGYSSSTGRNLEGFLGEVVIYNDVLSTADFEYQFDVLARKWVESRAVAPADGTAIAIAPSVQLTWNNILPDTEGGDVYVDLWFGTDAEAMSLEVDGGKNTTTTSVSISDTVEDAYYWAVDTYLDGDPAVGRLQ